MTDTDHIEGHAWWFKWREEGIGHRCLLNVYRVSFAPYVYCGCGSMIPREIRDDMGMGD